MGPPAPEGDGPCMNRNSAQSGSVEAKPCDCQEIAPIVEEQPSVNKNILFEDAARQDSQSVRAVWSE